MKQVLIFSLVLLCSTALKCQIDSISWTKYLGNEMDISNCLMTETPQNTIAVFAPYKGNLLCVEVDQKGDTIRVKHIPFSRSTLKTVKAYRDGFVLVGSMRGTRKLGQIPTVWRMNSAFDIDENSEWRSSDSSKGIFNDFFFTNDQQALILLGKEKNKMMIYRLELVSGNFTNLYTDTDKSEGSTILKGIEQTAYFHVLGHRNSKGLPTLTVWQFQLSGQLIQSYTHSTANTTGQHILRLQDGNLFLTGTQYTNAVVTNFYLRIPDNLNVSERYQQAFGFPDMIYSSEKTIVETNLIAPGILLSVGEHIANGASQGHVWSNWLPASFSRPPMTKDSIFYDTIGRATDILRLRNNDFIIASIFENQSSSNIKLRCYKSGTNPCAQSLESIGQPYLVIPKKDTMILSEHESHTLEWHLLSKYKIDKDAIEIEVTSDNRKLPDMDTLTLVQESTSYHKNEQYCYNLRKEIDLKEGNNSISVAINDTVISTFNRARFARPNLHIISIGINGLNLKSCGADARVIDTLFRNQEGKLFRKVFSYQKIVDADKQNNKKKLSNFLTDTFNKIDTLSNKNDIVLFFLSSHGEIIKIDNKDKFVIPVSNFKEKNPATYLVYEKEVLGGLKKVDAKNKLIIIDACKSRGAKSRGIKRKSTSSVGTSIEKIISTPPGIITLSSSEVQQFSYECEGNGAFTLGLKQAFSHPRMVDGIINQVQDNRITLLELERYLQEKMHAISRACGGDQTPNLDVHKLDKENEQALKNLPIFYYH